MPAITIGFRIRLITPETGTVTYYAPSLGFVNPQVHDSCLDEIAVYRSEQQANAQLAKMYEWHPDNTALSLEPIQAV